MVPYTVEASAPSVVERSSQGAYEAAVYEVAVGSGSGTDRIQEAAAARLRERDCMCVCGQVNPAAGLRSDTARHGNIERGSEGSF